MALVPFTYNLRSLTQRRGATVLTVLSVAATVAVVAGMLALRQGFQSLFTERGRRDLAVFLRFGATSEGESLIPRDRVEILLKETPEVALDVDGQPLASAEMYSAVRRRKADGGETNVPIRGVQPKTFAIHGDDLRIVEGRRFEAGADEVIVGQGLAGRVPECRVGSEVVVNTTPLRVVGVFESKGAYQAEIWGDADRMMNALQRSDYSRILAQLRPGAEAAAIHARLENDKRVPSKVMSEAAYLASQTGALGDTFMILASFLGVIMGIAAALTGANSMLASITARTHEIGVLLSVGYRPWPIFLSFLAEAAILGVLGGVLGCLLVLPLNGITTGTTNFQTFTETVFAFRVGPSVLLASVVFALALGILGGVWPALRAARLRPTEALRRV
jgi:putative ABC transport system permease protein